MVTSVSVRTEHAADVARTKFYVTAHLTLADATAASVIIARALEPQTRGGLRWSASERANSGFWQKRTFPSRMTNDWVCEGFRALASESLQCRNPRAPRAGLWVKRFWDGSGG